MVSRSYAHPKLSDRGRRSIEKGETGQAIAGLLLLCYGFLPMYRRLNLYTLSQYLGDRYDDRRRGGFCIFAFGFV